MRFCQKHHGDAFVRIGVTGKSGGETKGLVPSYRVDYPAADGTLAVFNGFGGTSHSAFTPTNTLETNWSRDHLTIREVQALYNDVKKDGTLTPGERLRARTYPDPIGLPGTLARAPHFVRCGAAQLRPRARLKLICPAAYSLSAAPAFARSVAPACGVNGPSGEPTRHVGKPSQPIRKYAYGRESARISSPSRSRRARRRPGTTPGLSAIAVSCFGERTDLILQRTKRASSR